MLPFFSKRPGLGIEITSDAVRLAQVSGSGRIAARKTELPAGTVTADYSSLNIRDPDGLVEVFRRCLDGISPVRARRAALSLPDGVFRVQTLEFDELPGKAVDRERLVRWRLEKSAFDISDTVLRYQVLKRPDKGFSVLACAAKSAVISQYESLLSGLGLEPWSVGVSSFHSLNLYSPFISKSFPVFALAHVSEDCCATIVAEPGGARFYRYKEVKRGSAEEITARLVREIGDSLHFYTHMASSQQNGVGRLYLTGDGAALPGLADGLKDMTLLDVEALSLSVMAPSLAGVGPELAAALGAGCGL